MVKTLRMMWYYKRVVKFLFYGYFTFCLAIKNLHLTVFTFKLFTILAPAAILYACDICDYAPTAHNRKTHIANEVACLPPHTFHKDDFVAMNLFYLATSRPHPCNVKAYTDAETTENPASFYEAKPQSGFTHVVGGFSVVVKTLRII